MLDAGYPLSEVTDALCSRWFADDPRLHLLPMSDDRVETHVVIADPDAPERPPGGALPGVLGAAARRPEALSVHQVGIERARPAPGVLEALAGADLVLVAPSNPVVSIGPILAVPGLREAVGADAGAGDRLRRHPGRRAGAGHGPPAAAGHRGGDRRRAVGRHYGARSAGGVLDVWAMDTRTRPRPDPGGGGRSAPGGHRPDDARPADDGRLPRVTSSRSGLSDHDLRPRRHRRGRGRAVIWPPSCWTRSPRIRPDRCRRATSWSSPPRSSARRPGWSRPADARGELITADTVRTVARRGETGSSVRARG